MPLLHPLKLVQALTELTTRATVALQNDQYLVRPLGMMDVLEGL
jgi:hypothetical protein